MKSSQLFRFNTHVGTLFGLTATPTQRNWDCRTCVETLKVCGRLLIGVDVIWPWRLEKVSLLAFVLPTFLGVITFAIDTSVRWSRILHQEALTKKKINIQQHYQSLVGWLSINLLMYFLASSQWMVEPLSHCFATSNTTEWGIKPLMHVG